MKCRNKHCPVEFDPDKEVCKNCKFYPDKEMDLPPGFEVLFKKKKQ